MFSPKGSAFIHVSQNAISKSGVLLHKRLQPTTTCTDLEAGGTLAGRFNYVGALQSMVLVSRLQLLSLFTRLCEVDDCGLLECAFISML